MSTTDLNRRKAALAMAKSRIAGGEIPEDVENHIGLYWRTNTGDDPKTAARMAIDIVREALADRDGVAGAAP